MAGVFRTGSIVDGTLVEASISTGHQRAIHTKSTDRCIRRGPQSTPSNASGRIVAHSKNHDHACRESLGGTNTSACLRRKPRSPSEVPGRLDVKTRSCGQLYYTIFWRFRGIHMQPRQTTALRLKFSMDPPVRIDGCHQLRQVRAPTEHPSTLGLTR